MAEAAKAPETPTQLINIGLIIATRSTIFASDFRKWHDKPEAGQTLSSFKVDFKAAQKAIKKSQPTITTDSLGFHEQTNATSLVDQVIDKLTAQRKADSTIITNAASEQQQMQQQLTSMENSTQQNKTMMDQMQSLMSTISSLQMQVNTNSNTQEGRDDGGRDHRNGREECGGRNRSGRNGGRQPPKYCWSHGNCAHTRSECEKKSDSHIDSVTYTNMQGGSTTKCHWL
jgi:hypothetical protein